MDLFTIHTKGNDLRIVGESGPLAVIPPLWAAWEGLWITFVLMVVAIGVVAVLAPLGLGVIVLGLIAITVAEGATLTRTELGLRGWREVGVAQAESEAGAEELYLTGRAVTPS